MTPMEIDLRYLSEERSRHGKTVLYARWKARRIRLRHAKGSPEFAEEYHQALVALGLRGGPQGVQSAKGIASYDPRTCGWLVLRYFKECPRFKAMRGRRRRQLILEKLMDEHGHRPMRIPTDKIMAGLARRAATPGSANDWLKALKGLYRWAKDAQIIADNPTDGVQKFKLKTDGFHTWEISELRAYVARHPLGTMGYLALIVLLLTGLRRDDATRLGRQHMRDGVLRFRTSKTGAEIVARVPWPIEQALAAMPPADLSLLRSARGQAFASGAAFGNWFKDRCVEAGIAHCTAHGLRKVGAVLAAEGGASEVELEAMYGWANNRQSGTYTRQARNQVLATKGFGRITEALVETGVVAEQKAIKIVAP